MCGLPQNNILWSNYALFNNELFIIYASAWHQREINC
eukprot:UN16296